MDQSSARLGQLQSCRLGLELLYFQASPDSSNSSCVTTGLQSEISLTPKVLPSFKAFCAGCPVIDGIKPGGFTGISWTWAWLLGYKGTWAMPPGITGYVLCGGAANIGLSVGFTEVIEFLLFKNKGKRVALHICTNVDTEKDFCLHQLFCTSLPLMS